MPLIFIQSSHGRKWKIDQLSGSSAGVPWAPSFRYIQLISLPCFGHHSLAAKNEVAFSPGFFIARWPWSTVRAKAESGKPLRPCSGTHPATLVPNFIGQRNSQGLIQEGGKTLPVDGMVLFL